MKVNIGIITEQKRVSTETRCTMIFGTFKQKSRIKWCAQTAVTCMEATWRQFCSIGRNGWKKSSKKNVIKSTYLTSSKKKLAGQIVTRIFYEWYHVQQWWYHGWGHHLGTKAYTFGEMVYIVVVIGTGALQKKHSFHGTKIWSLTKTVCQIW